MIAHELAHQWFGDKITCGSWKDIWLNEGFATYLAALVIEDFDGDTAFTNWRQSTVSNITSSPSGSVYLSDSDTLSVGRIFSGRLSYNKGAMVLHMLRKKLGDASFFQGMQDYLVDPDHAYDYAKTEDYKSIMETASGENLTEFFNDWIYDEGYPSYNVFWSYSGTNQIMIQLDQSQSHASVSFFEAPVPLRLVGTMGETLDIVLDHTTNGQIFYQSVGFTVASVVFDPKHDLISRNNNVTLSSSSELVESQLEVYPNPTSDILLVNKPDSLEIKEVKIFNTLGQLVFQQSDLPFISLENVVSGMYFIQIHTNHGTVFKKVLKK